MGYDAPEPQTFVARERIAQAQRKRWAKWRAERAVAQDQRFKGRFLDNIFVERLWRSLNSECVYLHARVTGSEAKAGVRKWIDFYVYKRPHSAFGGKPPAVIYWQRNEATQPDQQVHRVV